MDEVETATPENASEDDSWMYNVGRYLFYERYR